MSLGSKAGPTTNTNTTTSGTSTVALPDWYNQYFQNVLGQGNNLYNGLNYTVMGQMPDQTMASMLTNYGLQNFVNRPEVSAYDVFGMGNNWQNGGPPTASQATAMPNLGPQGMDLNNLPKAQADQAQFIKGSPAQLQPGDIPPFLNPYIETALNPTLDYLNKQQAETKAQIGGKAAASGMFGGSRQAVENSLADRDYRDKLATTAGNMLKGGWDSAAGLASGNTDRTQQTNMQNTALQNAMNTSNAQMGTQVSLANAGNAIQAGGKVGDQNLAAGLANQSQGNQIAQLNAQLQNQLLQQFYGNLFTGDQNDAARFLQAVQSQQGIDSNTLASILAGSSQLNQLGTQQQATGQKALDSYWQQLNALAGLLGTGKTGATTTSNSTSSGTSTQSKPIDLASILLGGAGLLFGK